MRTLRSQAKKILVIGGAGYVGCVLVEELQKRGYAVKVFDRLYFGVTGLQSLRDRVEVVTGDMRATDPSLFEDIAAVINLGGLRCVESRSIDSSTIGYEDNDVPAPGKAFFYMVEYTDGWRSEYGTESAATPSTPAWGGCQ